MERTANANPSFTTEFFAGLATFLTLSYVLVLNPVLLGQTGIDPSAAFFATVVSSGIATLIMGLWARLPFAIAPAPSITTFFVSYVCLTMGLSWQAALAAVFLSGILSIAMAMLAIRQRLIDATPFGLKIGILFAIGGFLVANGLSQAKLVEFSTGFIGIRETGNPWPGVVVLLVGLSIATVLHPRSMRFSGGPLVGILTATVVATFFGIRANTNVELGPNIFMATFALDFSAILDWRILSAMFVFFIIDFFGGVGKFIGLFGAMEVNDTPVVQGKGMGRALYVDGAGNMIGGLFGASSLAVFISSAVGIRMGGRTGRTAVVVACLIFASFLAFPLVGAIPTEATSGILIFIGLLLIPWPALMRGKLGLHVLDYVIFAIAFMIAFMTFGLDKALLIVFAFYSLKGLRRGRSPESVFLAAATICLAGAVTAEVFLRA